MKPEQRVYGPDVLIDVESEWAVKGWAVYLEATEEQVREAVERVGPRAEDVRRYLAK
jgi:hypothetical protein